MPKYQTTCRAVTVRLLPTVILCGFAFGGALAADVPVNPPVAVQQINDSTRRIELRSDTLLEYPDWLTVVKGFDPKLIRITAVRPNCLRIQGLSQGTTTLQAVDRGGHQYSIEVIVRTTLDGQ